MTLQPETLMFAAPTLTQIVANPSHYTVARDLDNCHRMHQRVTALCCPADLGASSRSAAGVLYRIERSTNTATVLVQSMTTPDPSVLPSGYGQARTRDMSPLLDGIRPGDCVRYRITAAPCRRVGGHAHTKERGKRVALHGDDAVQWWRQKAAGCGLRVKEVEVPDSGVMRGRKVKKGPPIVHPWTRFDGVAVVVDAEALRSAVVSGVGPGRSYGLGMLSIAKR